MPIAGTSPCKEPVPAPDTIRSAPKALLHDHLDGGLRPATIVDLASEYGHELPTTDVDELTTWFRRGADRKSLELYLETFQHTSASCRNATRSSGRRRMRGGLPPTASPMPRSGTRPSSRPSTG